MSVVERLCADRPRDLPHATAVEQIVFSLFTIYGRLSLYSSSWWQLDDMVTSNLRSIAYFDSLQVELASLNELRTAIAMRREWPRKRARQMACGSIPHSAFSLYQRKASVPSLSSPSSSSTIGRIQSESDGCKMKEKVRRLVVRRKKKEKQMTKQRKIKLHEHNALVVYIPADIYIYISVQCICL